MRTPLAPAHRRRSSSKRIFRAMGSESYIEIVHPSRMGLRARQSIRKAVSLCFEKEARFNRFDPKSEISTLNTSLKTFHTASPDMITLALHAIDYQKASGGLFDPRILGVLEGMGYRKPFSVKVPEGMFRNTSSLPDTPLDRDIEIWGERIRFRKRMDFSGIAKGYILDKMADSLRNDHWEHFVIDCGGDMIAEGLDRANRPWEVAVEYIPDNTLILALSGKSYATSSARRRSWRTDHGEAHHLVHPKHPQHFSFMPLSVSVIASTAETADLLAKTLLLMGWEHGIEYANHHRIPAVFVQENGSWKSTTALKRYRMKKNF